MKHFRNSRIEDKEVSVYSDQVSSHSSPLIAVGAMQMSILHAFAWIQNNMGTLIQYL